MPSCNGLLFTAIKPKAAAVGKK